jgi:hypothetical protein
MEAPKKDSKSLNRSTDKETSKKRVLGKNLARAKSQKTEPSKPVDKETRDKFARDNRLSDVKTKQKEQNKNGERETIKQKTQETRHSNSIETQKALNKLVEQETANKKNQNKKLDDAKRRQNDLNRQVEKETKNLKEQIQRLEAEKKKKQELGKQLAGRSNAESLARKQQQDKAVERETKNKEAQEKHLNEAKMLKKQQDKIVANETKNKDIQDKRLNEAQELKKQLDKLIESVRGLENKLDQTEINEKQQKKSLSIKEQIEESWKQNAREKVHKKSIEVQEDSLWREHDAEKAKEYRNQPKSIKKILIENRRALDIEKHFQLRKEIKEYRSGLNSRIDIPETPKDKVKGGTAAVARTNIPELDQETFKGASPEALLAEQKNTPDNTGSKDLIPVNPDRTVNHAEHVVLGKIHEAIKRNGLPSEQLKDKKVTLLIEQESCSDCASGIGTDASPGVIKQFSIKYPELLLEVKNLRTSRSYILQAGELVSGKPPLPTETEKLSMEHGKSRVESLEHEAKRGPQDGSEGLRMRAAKALDREIEFSNGDPELSKEYSSFKNEIESFTSIFALNNTIEAAKPFVGNEIISQLEQARDTLKGNMFDYNSKEQKAVEELGMEPGTTIENLMQSQSDNSLRKHFKDVQSTQDKLNEITDKIKDHELKYPGLRRAERNDMRREQKSIRNELYNLFETQNTVSLLKQHIREQVSGEIDKAARERDRILSSLAEETRSQIAKKERWEFEKAFEYAQTYAEIFARIQFETQYYS